MTIEETMIDGEAWSTSNLEVVNPLGIHARPSGLIVQTATPYQKEIYLVVLERKEEDGSISPGNPTSKYNCKSIFNLLGLETGKGSKLKLYVQGNDEASKKMAKSIEELFTSGFSEVYKK
jgi:phosphocarrier protein